MKVYLQTLTPLHIGTGDVYQKVDYVIDKQRFYKIDAKDFENFISLFPDEKEELMGKYIEWIDMHIDAITGEQVAKNNLLLKFKSDKFKMSAFAAYIQKTNEYRKMLTSKGSYPVYGDNVDINVRELAGSYEKNQYHIAGSSIKGSIRTALLFKVYQHLTNYNSELQTRIDVALTNYQRSKSPKKRNILEKDLESAIEYPLYCDYLDDRGNSKHNSEYYDICKFLQITDAHLSYSGNNNDPIQVWQTQRFNEKLIKNESTQTKTYEIELQSSSNPLVVWRSDLVWEFEIEIQLIQILRIYENLKLDTRNRKIWIGFEEKIKDFFGIDIAGFAFEMDKIINSKEKEEKIIEKQIDIEKALIQTVHSFYSEVLNFEKKWFTKERTYTSDEKKNAFRKVYNKNWKDKNLLRMSYAAGFPAHTELLMMLNNKNTKEQMRKIMKVLKIGNNRNNREEYIPNLEDFPKSRLLTFNGASSMFPLGWCELSSLKIETNAEKQTEFPKAEKQHKIEIFAPNPIKKNSIINGRVLSGTGAQKTVELYLYNNEKQLCTFTYQSDAIIDKLCQFVVTGYQNGKVSSITFKGFI